MINALAPGILLISDPFLKDPNFLRTAILLCEYNAEGCFGFVLNKPYHLNIGELIEGLEGNDFTVHIGGPMQQNTIHFIHQCPDFISDGIEIKKGIFWGGNFEQVKALLHANSLTQKDIRFFVGYSGWSEGQLESEIEDKSWITRSCSNHLVFSEQSDKIWKDALKGLGGEYELMPNYPINPNLN